MSGNPPADATVACPACNSPRSVYERTLVGYRLERCSECALVFVNPRPNADAVTELYRRKTPESQAEFYSETVSPAQIVEYDRIVRDIAELLPAAPRLLDVGCAAGYFLERATAMGFDAHGIDLAPWVEEIARERGVPNVRSGRLQYAGYATASFDAVHSSQVLEHLPTPHDELSEIRRLLKPGGILYVNVPNYRCLSIVVGKDDFELNTPPEHLSYFTPKTLTRLLEKAGFRVLRTSSYGGLKWENLLGRPIKSEIAEAVRAKSAGRSSASVPALRDRPVPSPGISGRALRRLLYEYLQFGMTLEAFARRD